jgi:multidrug efflux pump subunit AcrB
LGKGSDHKKLVIGFYFLSTLAITTVAVNLIGKTILPPANDGQFQVRLRAPQGSRLEHTEATLLQAQDVLYKMVGKENVEITSAFLGTQPANFATLPIILFTSSSNEILLQVALKPAYKIKNTDELEESYRNALHQEIPDVSISFEPIDLTDKIMSQGAATPIEVAIMGKDLEQSNIYAQKVMRAMRKIPYLRDIGLKEQLKNPAILINIDREKVKQLGLSMTEVSNSLTSVTSSSRYIQKMLWMD